MTAMSEPRIALTVIPDIFKLLLLADQQSKAKDT